MKTNGKQGKSEEIYGKPMGKKEKEGKWKMEGTIIQTEQPKKNQKTSTTKSEP